MQNIVMFLQQYGISATTAVKVHNSLGANSVELIKKNPYILSDMVDGISFKTSDTIAFNMGLPKNSIMRIRSGIIPYFTQCRIYKRSCIYAERCINRAYRLHIKSHR